MVWCLEQAGERPKGEHGKRARLTGVGGVVMVKHINVGAAGSAHVNTCRCFAEEQTRLDSGPSMAAACIHAQLT